MNISLNSPTAFSTRFPVRGFPRGDISGEKTAPAGPAGAVFYVNLLALRVNAAAGQVLLDHQRHLEGDGIVEFPQIQTRQLLDLLQTVHQGVAVDEQLPRRLRHVQVVLEELVNGEQRLLIQRVDGVLLEHLLQEHLAQGGGSW